MYNKFLSYLLKEIRTDKKMTQKEMALLLDKSEISIRKYESGENKISFATLYLLFHLSQVRLSKIKDFFLKFAFNTFFNSEEIEKVFLNSNYYLERKKVIHNDKSYLMYFENFRRKELEKIEDFNRLLILFNDDLNKIFNREDKKQINILEFSTFNIINEDFQKLLKYYIEDKYLFRIFKFFKGTKNFNEKKEEFNKFIAEDEKIKNSLEDIQKKIISFSKWVINEEVEEARKYLRKNNLENEE